MITLKQEHIIEFDGRFFQVTEVDERQIKLLPVDGGLPVLTTPQEVEAAYNDGRVTLCNKFGGNWVSGAYAFFLLPEKDRRVALRREHFARVMDDEALPDGQIPQKLLPRISNRVVCQLRTDRGLGWMGRPPSSATLRRWYRSWVEGGRSIDALAPQHFRKGSRPHSMPHEIEAAMQQAIEEGYLTRQKLSRKRVYMKYLEPLIANLNRYRPSGEKLPLPSLKTFARRIAEIDPFIRDQKRHGQDFAVANQRMVRRDHRRATRPNEIWQVDATRVDLRVVHWTGSKVKWWRPWLTTIIDQYTRCIVGYHLSFDSPNTESVAAALRMALRPKADLLALYPNVRNEWSFYGQPYILICDNGRENHSEAFRDLCGVLGIELLYTPRKRPQNKPHIERFFRTLNERSHELPGTTFSNPVERGDYNAEKQGGLTIGDFEAWLVRHIVDEYHQQYHSGILKAPAHMWQDSVEEEAPQLPARIVEEEAFFMRQEDRTLQKDGIHFDNLVYFAPELQELYDRQKKVGVTIRYSKDSLDTIWVKDPKRKRWVTAHCANMPEYSQKHDRRQHKEIVALAKENGALRIDSLAIAESAYLNGLDMNDRAAKMRRNLKKLAREAAGRQHPLTPRRDAKNRFPKPGPRPDSPGNDQFDNDWSAHSLGVDPTG